MNESSSKKWFQHGLFLFSSMIFLSYCILVWCGVVKNEKWDPAYETTNFYWDITKIENSEKLEVLPKEVKFPTELKNKIYYDHDRYLITFKGVMNNKEMKKLQGLTNNEHYEKAIEALYQRCRRKIEISVKIEDLPKKVKFPDDLKDKIYFDHEKKLLTLKVVMNDEENETSI